MDAINPCCATWKMRYSKMEGKRNTLRQGVDILKSQIDRLQLENDNLKKACDEERKLEEAVDGEKGKEAALRLSMEKEVDALKSELAFTKPEVVSGKEELNNEIMRLRGYISDKEKEIHELKEILTEVKRRAEAETEGAELTKKKASELQKALESEKNRADEACKIVDVMGKKAEQSQVQLENLKIEVKNSRMKCNEVAKKLEVEKQKTGKEKKRADEEKARTIEQRKIAEANEKKYMDEKNHTSGLLTMLEEEKQKVEKLRQEMVELVSSQSSANASELNEVKRNLEAEIKKADREKKHADSEMLKKEEQRKVAEANIQKAMEENSHADELCRNLQCSRQRIEDLEKKLLELNVLLETERENASGEKKHVDEEKLKVEELQKVSLLNEKRFTEEKCRADNLFEELQHDRQRVLELENELHKFKSCGNPGVASSAPLDVIMNEQKAKVNLLQKQLKFEKERVKHAKDVAELEKDRNSILQKEMNILRQDFECLLHHLDVLGDTFGARHGLNNVSKKLRLSNEQNGLLSRRLLNSIPPRRYGPGDAELRMCSFSSRDESCHLQENNVLVPAERCTESPSGMEIDLDQSGETLPSSALNLYTTPFSDEQLVGSQERFAGSLTTSVKMASENTNLEDTTAKQSDEFCRQNDVEKVGIITENNLRSPVEFAICHAEKRRDIVDEIESIKCMNSQGKRIMQVEETISCLHNTLTWPIIEQMEKENFTLTGSKANICGNYDQHGNKRKTVSHESQTILPQVHDVNFQKASDNLEPPPVFPGRIGTFWSLGDASRDSGKSHEEALISFEQMIDKDYMKLLSLDDVEEELFKTAMDKPVSLSLPEIGFHDTIPISVAEKADVLRSSAHGESRVVCVVFPDMKDGKSISRIFQAIKACSDLCGLFLQRKWLVQDVLAVLVLEEDLSPRDKVCVLFSLMLINVSEILPGNFKDIINQELRDSFSAHLHSVLLDGDTRSFFVNTCDLRELLSLVEDFVFSRRMLSESNTTSAPVNSFGSSYEVLLKGEKITLCPIMASTNLVTGACFVLASICRIVGHIDFVCEVSFNLLHSSSVDKSTTLMILHIFSYLCGEEFFTTSNFRLVMEVVKSVITFIEGNVVDNDLQLHSPACDPCPFSKSCDSLDVVSSLLLEELQGRCSQHMGQLDYNLYDILSSLELIASTMHWDWTCDKIVPKLAEMLESYNHGEDFVVLVSFLCQLGRHGAEASGYDNDGVEMIRSNLFEILCRHVTFKSDTCPPISDMTVVVCALLGLYPHICEELGKGNTEFLFNGEPSSSSAVLKECLSSLSSDQIITLFGGFEKSAIAAHCSSE